MYLQSLLLLLVSLILTAWAYQAALFRDRQTERVDRVILVLIPHGIGTVSQRARAKRVVGVGRIQLTRTVTRDYIIISLLAVVFFYCEYVYFLLFVDMFSSVFRILVMEFHLWVYVFLNKNWKIYVKKILIFNLALKIAILCRMQRFNPLIFE